METDLNYTHIELVKIWEEKNTKDLSDEQLIQVYGSAIHAIENCCMATLSRVTINVVLDRVLCLGSEKFPILLLVTIEHSGLSLKCLNQNIKNFKTTELKCTLCHILVEFLTVIGNITSNVLTASLHKAFMLVTSKSALNILEVQSLHSINSKNKKRGVE